jgi:hypothetical protein
MGTITETASRFVRRVVSGIGGLLPSPPPTGPPPPDVDGHRGAGEEDAETAFDVTLLGKDGHGGTR